MDGSQDSFAQEAVPAGDFLAGQRLLAAGRAYVTCDDVVALRVSGDDSETFLDALLSQRLTGLELFQSAEALLLDPNGRIQDAVALVKIDSGFLLLVDAARAEPLAAWLTSMRFMMRVDEVARVPEVTVLGSMSPASGAHDVLSGDGLRSIVPDAVVWHDPWPGVVAGGHGYATTISGAPWSLRLTVLSAEGMRALAPVLNDAGVKQVTTDALTALRIAAWRPWFASEVDNRALPHEYDWLRTAVHLNKGCYRGQETVAKVHNLGHPPRRLVQLYLDGSDPTLPQSGDEVFLGDKQVGHVTSVALHHEEGPSALALVKRNLDDQKDLDVVSASGRMRASQRVIVPVDAGAIVAETVRAVRANR